MWTSVAAIAYSEYQARKGQFQSGSAMQYHQRANSIEKHRELLAKVIKPQVNCRNCGAPTHGECRYCGS